MPTKENARAAPTVAHRTATLKLHSQCDPVTAVVYITIR